MVEKFTEELLFDDDSGLLLVQIVNHLMLKVLVRANACDLSTIAKQPLQYLVFDVVEMS